MDEKKRRIKKMPTRIKGLDQVLNGGIPEQRITVIKGGPGHGKSVFAMETAWGLVSRKMPCVAVNFEESKKEIFENYHTFGWDFEQAEADGLLGLICPELKPVIDAGGDFDVMGFQAIVGKKAEALQSRVVVLDALDVLLSIFDTPKRQREVIETIHYWLRENAFTCIITSKTWHTSQAFIFDPEMLDYMVSCLIELDQKLLGQHLVRSLTVRKYRGADYKNHEHPFVITDKGVVLVPVSGEDFCKNKLGYHESTGVPSFDLALGGGIRQKACTIIAGPTGSGKSTLAAAYAAARTDEGKKVVYIGFDQSEAEIIDSVGSVGIDLEMPSEEGLLSLLASTIESKDVEQHLVDAVQLIEAFEPGYVIVDTISACERMGSSLSAFNYVIRLVSYCNKNGLTTILVNQTSSHEIEGLAGVMTFSMVDTIIRLSMAEMAGEINRLFMVIKSRGSAHSNQFLEFFLTDHGIDVRQPYEGVGEPLSGTARSSQEMKEKMEELELELARSELERKILIAKSERNLDMLKFQNRIDNLNAKIRDVETMEKIAQSNKEEMRQQRGQAWKKTK